MTSPEAVQATARFEGVSDSQVVAGLLYDIFGPSSDAQVRPPGFPSNQGKLYSQKALLALLEQRGIRNPRLVLRHGRDLLLNAKSLLGSEMWPLYEQICVAAMDASLPEVRNECLVTLETQFPASLRVLRLRGLVYEAAEQWDDALRVYAELLDRDRVAVFPRKRRIAVFRARGQLRQAIEALTEYTSIFAEDPAGWTELYELELEQGRFQAAAFAAEELVLLRPEHHVYTTMLADALYAQGGDKARDLARQYYAAALELKPDNNLRAALGLLRCLQTGGLTAPHHAALYDIAEGKVHAQLPGTGAGAAAGALRLAVERSLRAQRPGGEQGAQQSVKEEGEAVGEEEEEEGEDQAAR